ncbi:hypothetical protein MTO96_047305 [Rhipicephalus appendiculatus]
MSMLRNRLGFGRSKARAGHVSVLSTWTSARLSLLSPAAHGLCNRTSGLRQVTVELRCFKVCLCDDLSVFCHAGRDLDLSV